MINNIVKSDSRILFTKLLWWVVKAFLQQPSEYSPCKDYFLRVCTANRVKHRERNGFRLFYFKEIVPSTRKVSKEKTADVFR